jgi:hypothetical protein
MKEDAMEKSAHHDSFTRDNLPPPELQPDFIFTLPELKYPPRLNCVTQFLDRWIAEGRGDHPCLLSPTETVSYRENIVGEWRVFYGVTVRVPAASICSWPALSVASTSTR